MTKERFVEILREVNLPELLIEGLWVRKPMKDEELNEEFLRESAAHLVANSSDVIERIRQYEIKKKGELNGAH